MKQKKRTKFVNDIILEYRDLISLQEWKVVWKYGKCEDSDCFAEVGVKIYDKVMDIVFSTECHKFDDAKFKNIIVHELVHGKVLINKKEVEEQVESILSYNEEKFVNEMVLAIMGE